MTQSHLQLEKIIELLRLKRQHEETILARIKKQDQDFAFAIESLKRSASPELEPSIDRIEDARLTVKWDQWRVNKTANLQKQRDGLALEMRTHVKALQSLIVQIDALEIKREKQEKQTNYLRENNNSNQRLETWLVSQTS